jgi:hypothetical protein
MIPASAPGQDTWGQEKSLKSVNCRHHVRMETCVTLGSFTLGSSHQAHERTQQSPFLDHTFVSHGDFSPVSEESLSFYSHRVEFTIKLK